MPPTIASLLADRPLGLRLLTSEGPAGDTSREVRWVHTTELNDPAPFLEGGELLLTTGLRLADPGFDLEAFLSGLVRAGVAGLGFGVGLNNAAVPERFVTAAAAHGLPVLEVPKATPFIAIAKSVSKALAAEEYRAITEGYRTQHDLVKSALAHEPQRSLVRSLVSGLGTGAWAVLAGADGSVLHSAGPMPAGLDLAPELDRLRGRMLPSSASILTDSGHVEVHALGVGKRVSGFLAVGLLGRDSGPDITGRQILAVALTLLTLGVEQPTKDVTVAELTLRRAVVRLLLAGHVDAAREAAGELRVPLPPEPVRIARDSVRDEAVPERMFVLEEGDERMLVAPADYPGFTGGVSDAIGYADFGRGYRQAGEALATARRTGRPTVSFAEAGSGLTTLFADQAVRDFAAAVLAPLTEADRAALMPTLRAWLAHNGQWDSAAAELGVHRHTVRARIARAGELLGKDLTAADSADARMELWFALRVREGQ
ncbi:PucR family transcriptional regulator [Catenulispora pinisilvae]|uniref:PucR family transcriptional regulator n=1 Tax=Catenulispora pinisilvae TaxID=2705253 RepID=UPI0018922032|nr:PucR family transcriptional regulator [Catenulispora pinisilvae]